MAYLDEGDYFWHVCMACLDELRRQQITDQHVYDQKLMDDTLRKLAREGLQKNIVMDKRTGEVLSPEILHVGKINFKPIL